MPNDEKPSRKHPASGVLHLPHQPTIVFDTVCTRDRIPWLANDDVHELLREVWQEATGWLVGRYVIMPDHIHYFAAATESAIEFKNWVRYWKSQYTKRHQVAEHRWLTDDWDTRMRGARQYEEKWEYIQANPVRHKLVSRPEDWPYRGEIHELRWD